MIINITNKTTVRDVQRKISVGYPFLKVEFLPAIHHRSAKHKAHYYEQQLKLLELTKHGDAGWVILHGWHKCDHIKKIFLDRFGLHVQFFRREKDEWIEISGTEVFTIEEQNQLGRRSVEKIHAPSRHERELLL